MKALKEKRIGLRSLWRRGLVILSLFALVFASCNSSGDDGGGETEPTDVTGPKVTGITISLAGLSAKQYEGTKIDPTGLKVTATYDDGDTKEIPAGSYGVKIAPEYAQGVLALDDSKQRIYWVPIYNYTITVAYQNNAAIATYTPIVVPISRNSSLTGNNSATLITGPAWNQDMSLGTKSSINYFYYDMGGKKAWETALNTANLGNLSASLDGYVLNSAINLTGDLTETAYVDDIFELSKSFRLQASYVDGQKKDLPTNANLKTEIWAEYSNGKEKTGTGHVVVSVQTPDTWTWSTGSSMVGPGGTSVTALYTATEGRSKTWFSAIHPLKEVYTVLSIKATGLPGDYSNDPTGLPIINYWDDEGTATEKAKTTALWIKAIDAAKVKLDVTYTDGNPGNKSLTMKQANDLGYVWWNENPNLGGNNALEVKPGNVANTFGIQNVRLSSTPENKLSANPAGYAYSKLAGVQGPAFTAQEIEGPAVKVNYRGAETYIPVDIVLQYDSWSAEYKNAEDSERGYTVVTLKPEDNDIKANAFDDVGYAALVTAEATYTTVRGGSVKIPLKYDEYKDYQDKDKNKQKFGTTLGNWQEGANDPNATFFRETYNLYSMNFGTANKTGVQGWGQVAEVANNNKTKAVTFYYHAPDYDEPVTGISKAAKNAKQSLNVEWHGIKAP